MGHRQHVACSFISFDLMEFLAESNNKTLFFSSDNFMALMIFRFLLTQSNSPSCRRANERTETGKSHKNYHYRKNSLA